MENAINTLRIQNFKSIKDATMHPRRVNLLIGQPNVGKSNILEAMSLLGAGLYDDGKRTGDKKFMEDVLRYETLTNLFYDNDATQSILVESSGVGALLLRNDREKEFTILSSSRDSLDNYPSRFMEYLPDYNKWVSELPSIKDLPNLNLKEVKQNIYQASISNAGAYIASLDFKVTPNEFPKKYSYHSNQSYEGLYKFSFLEPPTGNNLVDVIQHNSILRKEVSSLFKSYGLSLVLRVSERRFEIQKQVEDLVYNYPYSLIADTLQRIIFYLAAIESNDDSVLLFEEPEAHQFPVYTSMLGRKIVESRNNQFFIATHSPYLVTEILEQMVPYDEQAGELAIFLAYYEDYQTKIKQLSDEEVRDIRGDSIDIFYNLARFTPRPVNG